MLWRDGNGEMIMMTMTVNSVCVYVTCPCGVTSNINAMLPASNGQPILLLRDGVQSAYASIMIVTSGDDDVMVLTPGMYVASPT